MKHIIKSLAAVILLTACTLSFTACDEHYEPRLTIKALEMYESTCYEIADAMPFFQQALYANAVLAADKAERELLINDYFGTSAEAFFNDSLGKFTVYTAQNFERLVIEHNNVLLTDSTSAAEWKVTITANTYYSLGGDFISGYEPLHFTVTSDPTGEGELNLTFHIDGIEYNFGTAILDLKWIAQESFVEFDNGMMELNANFTPVHGDWNCLLEVTTIEPAFAIYDAYHNSIKFQSGEWHFHAVNSQKREVEAGVSFYLDNGMYMLRTLYKGVSEEFSQR